MNAATVVAIRQRMVERMPDAVNYHFTGAETPDADEQWAINFVGAMLGMLADDTVPSFRVPPHVAGTMFEAGRLLPEVVLQFDEPAFADGCVFFDAPTDMGHLERVIAGTAEAFTPAERDPIGDKLATVKRVDCHGFAWMTVDEFVVVTLLVRYPDIDLQGYPAFGPLIVLRRGEAFVDESPEMSLWAGCIAALWRFMGQNLIVTEDDVVSRQVRRDAERHGKSLAPVRVIQLRHASQADVERGERIGREWSHRWIVRGHWRNQWHPATQTHRLQWIDPYLKGPEDKPLVVRPTVYEVVR